MDLVLEEPITLDILHLFKALMLLNMSYFIVFPVFVIIVKENLPMSYTVASTLPTLTKDILIDKIENFMAALSRLDTLAAHHYSTIDQSS